MVLLRTRARGSRSAGCDVRRLMKTLIPILAVLSLASLHAPAANIGFVVDPDGAVDGLFDQFWVDRLEDQGHDVTILGADYPLSGVAEEVDIFIVSNDVGSGDFTAPVGGIAPEVEFTDFEGDAWFGGGDLDGGFAGGPPRLLTLDPVDISGQSNVELVVSVAARPTGWDEGQDFVFFNLDVTGNGQYDNTIAEFFPNFDGDMEEFDTGLVLDTAFQDLTIPIDSNVDTLRLQVDAFSTASGEQFGLDNIRVESGGQTIATETFEGQANSIGYTAEGQGGAGSAFWDRVVDTGGAAPTRMDDARPIITYETALYDEFGLSTGGVFRQDDMTIQIDDPDHPLAAGLSGDVDVYVDFQGISQLGEELGPEVDVVASLFDVPVIAVLEAGAEGLDGNPAPGQRIAFFPQDIGDGDLYTDDGLALLDAVVSYALGVEQTVQLQPGDSDQDLDFDQLDLVQVQIAAKYLTGQTATWGEGDWNGAPGGEPGNPPPGNGFFDQLDIVSALGAGKYLTGPYGAIQPEGRTGDGQTSVVYNADTGELSVDPPADTHLTSINIDSASGIFTGDPAANLEGSFDHDANDNIFKATFGGSFGPVSFGKVAQVGLTEEFLLGDLTVVGSLAGGGDLGPVDLVYVPEPASTVLLVVGLLGGLLLFRRAGP